MKHAIAITFAIGCLCSLAGCSPPVGLTKVTPEQSYRDSVLNSLSEDGISSEAMTVLHRHDLDGLYHDDPAAALQKLHTIALKDERRDILYALAEASYAWGKSLPDSVTSATGQPTARDVYLQSAIYAYLYLLGQGSEPLPSAYDNRFRAACELYNRALEQAFRQAGGENLSLASGRRQLMFGSLPVRVDLSQLSMKGSEFKAFYPADDYEVFGFSSRNRSPGLGMPVIGVTRNNSQAPNGGTVPITAFLRIQGGLRELSGSQGRAALELYSSYDDHQVTVNGQVVPLQSDTSAPIAYRLNDPALWNAGLKTFLGGGNAQNHMMLIQPYEPGRIPVVMVHGTGSSPVWWAEMVNTLKNDPVIRNRYQFWFYEYVSNLPVATSGYFLRDTLTKMVQQLDPNHQDKAMQKMVVIGHSQGGLLTHLAAVDPGDKLWKSISDEPFDRLVTDPEIKTGLQNALFFKPLPFIRRVVFISTPHRGSFLTKSWVRELARNVITLPITLFTQSAEKFKELTGKLKLPESLRNRLPTSVDGMSGDSPVMKTLLGLPLAPGISGHSIIAVLPGQDIRTGNDGVVEYSSAHIDGMESELVVRTGHSAQGHPLAIEEVRRILLENINSN